MSRFYYLGLLLCLQKTSGEKDPSNGETNLGFCITITLLHIPDYSAKSRKTASTASLLSRHWPSELFYIPQVEIEFERMKVWIIGRHHGKFALRVNSKETSRSLEVIKLNNLNFFSIKTWELRVGPTMGPRTFWSALVHRCRWIEWLIWENKIRTKATEFIFSDVLFQASYYPGLLSCVNSPCGINGKHDGEVS